MEISITPEVEPDDYSEYDDLEWGDYVALIGSNVYNTKTKPKLWTYFRLPENCADTLAALNELRISQEEIAKGKKAYGNESWRNTALFVAEITNRIQGVKNRQHDRQVAELKRQIANLENKLEKEKK